MANAAIVAVIIVVVIIVVAVVVALFYFGGVSVIMPANMAPILSNEPVSTPPVSTPPVSTPPVNQPNNPPTPVGALAVTYGTPVAILNTTNGLFINQCTQNGVGEIIITGGTRNISKWQFIGKPAGTPLLFGDRVFISIQNNPNIAIARSNIAVTTPCGLPLVSRDISNARNNAIWTITGGNSGNPVFFNIPVTFELSNVPPTDASTMGTSTGMCDGPGICGPLVTLTTINAIWNII